MVLGKKVEMVFGIASGDSVQRTGAPAAQITARVTAIAANSGTCSDKLLTYTSTIFHTLPAERATRGVATVIVCPIHVPTNCR